VTATEPRVLTGLAASPGLAVGPARRMVPPPELPTTEPSVTDRDAELRRAIEALDEVADELEETAGRASGEAAGVLAAQAMMARDVSLRGSVQRAVESGRAAPWAVRAAIGEAQEMMRAAGGYLAERVSDLEDLANRTIAKLLGVAMPGLPQPEDPDEAYVLFAGDLAPADTATLPVEKVLAIVTERGGPTGHSAIIARAAGIPAVVSCPGAADVADGETVVVRVEVGETAEVIRYPTDDEVQAVERERTELAARLAGSKGPGSTADGHRVQLLANVGSVDNLSALTGDSDAEGVGLFRTEVLFLDRASAPGIDEQREAYRTLLAALPGRDVVIRTLDAGSDKPLAFVQLGDEPNPALGVRGYRTAAVQPRLLDDQLAAIASAAGETEANVRVMAPMISTPDEAAAFVEQARKHGLSSVGVMIEVPAAALRIDEIAEVVDFVSIGTNDLAQYTFAADRTLGDVAHLLDPWQPALLQLIARVAGALRRLGKPVSLCGEAAADPLLAPVLAGFGFTSLSMAPTAIPAVRAALAEVTLDECRRRADRVLAAVTPVDARAAAKS
jgi:phosphotransferase system enzyme I (PtsI)